MQADSYQYVMEVAGIPRDNSVKREVVVNE
jgi:hypothetical protein